MKKVDLHCHYYPDSFIKELAKVNQFSIVGQNFSKVKWDSSEKYMSEMDGYGIDVAVLGLGAPHVYFNDKEFSLALAQMANDELSEICRKNPNRFGCLASIPLVDMKYALDELNRAVDKLHMDGITLGTNINGTPLESREFLPFFEEVNKKEIPVVLHPTATRWGTKFMENYDTEPMIGLVFETTLTVTTMVLDGFFERFPNIKMVLPHLGGTIPFLDGRIDLIFKSHEVTRRGIGHTGKLPCDYLKKLHYDTALTYLPALKCTTALSGIDQILFGTDFPYTRGFRVPAETAVVEKSDYSIEEKEKIFFKNAMNFIPRLHQAAHWSTPQPHLREFPPKAGAGGRATKAVARGRTSVGSEV